MDRRRSLHYFLLLFIKSYTLLGRYSKIHLLLYYAYNLLFLFCKKKRFYTISPSNYSMSIGKCYTVANLSVTFSGALHVLCLCKSRQYRRDNKFFAHVRRAERTWELTTTRELFIDIVNYFNRSTFYIQFKMKRVLVCPKTNHSIIISIATWSFC